LLFLKALARAIREIEKSRINLARVIFFCKNCIIDYQEVIAIDTQLLFGM